MINDKEIEIEAAGINIDNGSILFFSDESCTKISRVVAGGQWQSLEVCEGSDQLETRQPISEEPAPLAEGEAVDVVESHTGVNLLDGE